MYVFAPFTLDTGNQCLWREAEMIALTPKSFSLLRVLVENAG
ncbi:MAG: response regulator transcription factor, partial [Bryobacterales bacterium]|nr:response regulator transcription factor [Bryobacterales bacterium]